MRNIIVNVFSQNKTNRILVGILWREDSMYMFQYSRGYLSKNKAIPLGPDLPLDNKIISSRMLFLSFLDRIPEKTNPAYSQYCEQWEIDPKEEDKLRLLVTIGHRGPSSFIFREDNDFPINGRDLKRFRVELGLTVREFAMFFDTQPSTVSKTERGFLESRLLLQYCEVLTKVPSALRFHLKKRGQFLHDDKINSIKGRINSMIEKMNSKLYL